MRAIGLVLVLLLTGCDCGPSVMRGLPSIAVVPTGVDFGAVRVGQSKALNLKLQATTRTDLTISAVRIEGPGAAAFKVSTPPGVVPSLGEESVTLTFKPPTVALLTATLVIVSDDPERGTLKVALVGEGALPKIELSLVCDAARGCTDTIAQQPPSIDFGLEPFMRANPPDPTKLPTVVVVNAGSVPLVVGDLIFGGADGLAFSIGGNNAFPDGGVTLQPAEGFNAPLQFVPITAAQISYAGSATISSDDPDRPMISVALSGQLSPNTAPTICANLIRVTPLLVTDTPRDYGSSVQWAPLLVPPAMGYDFSATRDVRPNDLAVFSALSTDASACTIDAEDGRTGLTYSWSWVATPPGAETLAIAASTTPQAQVRPVVTGTYTLRLTVTDSGGANSSTTITFGVAIKQDFVTQLTWEGTPNVDLDVHLVRPSSVTGVDPFTGAFSFFAEGAANTTSGDINGYASRQALANPGLGFNFDWGQPGSIDDPILNVDDTGTGQLLENVSLNCPEHDALCDGGRCTYRVMVHYFEDRRGNQGPACIVDGGVECHDGERCSCAVDQRCVAQSALAGTVATGAGKCFTAPKPVVKLFFKGSPTPAAVIPLQPSAFVLGAPCTLWHVADVAWPALSEIGSLPDGGTPSPTVSIIGQTSSRFGVRQAGGDLKCTPDSTRGSIDWYSQQP